MTSRFELAVLRDLLLPARTSLEIRTRRPKKRPDRLPLFEVQGGEFRARDDVAVADHPTYMALPRFRPPARLRGADKPELRVIAPPWATLVGRTSLAEASRRRGAAVGLELSVDPYEFARMIGKIAHCFAFAAKLGSFKDELPAFLRADDESIGWLVGGAPDVSLTKPGLHAAGVRVIDGVVHVRVRLFAQLGAPEYLVLAGRPFAPGANSASPEST